MGGEGGAREGETAQSADDFRIRYYERQATRVVEGLHDLADRIEREATPYGKAGVTGTPRYLAAAEQVNHTLTWGLANLGAYRLFDAAFHADDAERDLPSAPPTAPGADQ